MNLKKSINNLLKKNEKRTKSIIYILEDEILKCEYKKIPKTGILPSFFVKKKEFIPSFLEIDEEYINIYELGDLDKVDTSDFDAIRNVDDALTKYGIFKRFWEGVSNLSDNLGKWDTLIAIALPILIILGLEYMSG